MRSLVVLALGLASCGDNERPPPDLDPIALVDTNPDPGIVEVELVAGLAMHEFLPGRPTEVWAFRDGSVPTSVGTIPGPLLEATLGDRVVVHFRNELPEATTVHWHGLRVPNAHDGTHVSQMLVPPGGDFTYDFAVEDAGLFWYHPHVNGDVQVERGLYAPIRIRGGVEPAVAADRVFVLDDVKVEATGALSDRVDALDIMLGRQGNVLLVNGRSDARFTATAGSRERWRVVNAANGRYFDVELPGHTLRVIGWDGGLLPEPYAVDNLVVAPGERYDLLVELQGQAGNELAVRNIYYDRGHDIPDPGPRDLLTIELLPARETLQPLPERWADVAAIAVDDATPRRSFVLREDAESEAEPFFTINAERYPQVTPVGTRTGDIEVWELDNETEMDHPFHLHGMSFQVLGDDLFAPRLGWKDTVNVPREDTVRIAVQFGAEGRWMYHCHILEHAERGMMGELVVSP
jgi:FtsP/CotA-like multicopper oxidase with cupredoxin domain